MNVSCVNPNSSCSHPSAHTRKEKQRLSCSTNSKSGHSSSLSYTARSKSSNSIPILIQLCICPDEDYAHQAMKTLLSSRHYCSPNVCDEFDCNVLMYTLRYQRFHLFEFLLNETSLDLDLRSNDQQGNSILHYAVIYGGNGTNIMDILIDRFLKFGIDIDARNMFGFTPLLFAVFCGRYDIALTLLTKTDASPFVRDYVQSTSILDYVDVDRQPKHNGGKLYNSHQQLLYPSENRDSTRLRIQIYKTLPRRFETSYQAMQNHTYRNFFENIFPQAVHDRSGIIRSSILKMLDRKHLSPDLTRLIQHLSHRHPRLINHRKANDSPSSTTSSTRAKSTATVISTSTIKIFSRKETSKTNVHNIFSLFDPDLRPKAKTTKTASSELPQSSISNTKVPPAFKRLSTKLAVVTMLSRSETVNRTTGTK